ncbi:Mechanosensitive ion channel [Halovenus aranensis]|jgi:small-conductance mechanosensitive channel|uniref:Mechanosensitive ion channel n=1 Tax=Halovenus aranensis TaxID=890420 RepID=A0A1G8T392_9EURY|nr:mechanosensitive ion channel domain-containing protein [Halovenus aranensis]SDJ36109.1 Mechanosensitive ion channel [Halovenus aranensis]
MTTNIADFIRQVFSAETAFTLAVGILIIGLVISYLVWRWTHRLFEQTGINDAVEGTSFERTAQGMGTSTAGIIGQILAVFVYVLTAIFAFNVAQIFDTALFWTRVTNYLPRLFIALVAIIVGLLAGEKGQLLVQERLQSIKLPEVAIIPTLVKYSIYYIAGLIALAQLGVATAALLVLLGAYAFGLVFLGGLAFKDLLAAAAAGIYLLLNEPYSIGDEVRIEGTRGIVQEMDMFVTHVETDGKEYIFPNQQILREGVVRIRE